MNPLANPVTEWGAPGAYTRSKILDPHNVPNKVEGDARTTPGGTSYEETTEGGHDIVARRPPSAANASSVGRGTRWGTV